MDWVNIDKRKNPKRLKSKNRLLAPSPYIKLIKKNLSVKTNNTQRALLYTVNFANWTFRVSDANENINFLWIVETSIAISVNHLSMIWTCVMLSYYIVDEETCFMVAWLIGFIHLMSRAYPIRIELILTMPCLFHFWTYCFYEHFGV